MEKLLDKMKEYLMMDTEISFEEFSEYYHGVIDHLQEKYEGMDQEELFKAKYILQIVASNAVARSQRKSEVSKKFRKMGEKASFWDKAINFRLINAGMSQGEINQAIAAVNPDEKEE